MGRWKEGQSLSDIGRALRKHAGAIHGIVYAKGGIAPRARRCSRQALTWVARAAISRGLAAGRSLRHLAKVIRRTPSTVSREVTRHGGAQRYRASAAEQAGGERARRPKACRLAMHPRLREVVAAKLALEWSPERIAGWLEQRCPDDETLRVSPATIYRSLFIQARGVLKKALRSHLRSRRMMRRATGATTAGQPRGQIIDAVSIRERPAKVEERAIPGHWEGDLFSGSNNSHLATLVARHSRFTLLVKVAGQDTVRVVDALREPVRKRPAKLRRSLTWERGMALANHKKFTIATDVKVYFCDPQRPWQRGTNENTNRLPRQYLPAGTNLWACTQSDLNKIALRLHQRPRKTLGYQTPAHKLSSNVALTH